VTKQPRAELTVTIDGIEHRASAGETILDVARRERVTIPTLCWLEGLTVWGGCRVCVVEVAEEHALRLACSTLVADGMEVRTRSPRLEEHRRTVVELLFAEGNHICAVCVANRSCELQDLATSLGIDHVRFQHEHRERKVDASHPRFLFDPDRCVLCTRCVRVCDEVEGAHVWEVASRGSDSYVVTGMNQPWGQVTACTSCGKCVAVCPTGALVEKGRGVTEVRHDPDLVRFLVTARTQAAWAEEVEA
jgi:bidirectional [NiFe] hydrogenase diaphorase subunit